MKVLLWIAFAFVLLAVVIGRDGQLPANNRSQRDEFLIVQKDARAIYLKTKDGSTRTECSIYLHGGYKTTIPGIPADKGIAIDLRAFIANGSLRFVPGVEPVTRVHVICHEPNYRSTVFGFS